MPFVYLIKAKHVVWEGGVSKEVPWLYGKKDAAIPASELTLQWIRYNGFKSAGAANRQVSRLPWWKNNPCSDYGATVESFPVVDYGVRYKIYRCYEIVIEDEDGNQIKESDYCYGTRKEAEELAQHEVKLIEEGC